MALHDYLATEVVLDCAEGALSRREALRRLMLLGLTGPAAVALLASCGSDDDTAGDTADQTTPATTPVTAPVTAPATTPALPAEETPPTSGDVATLPGGSASPTEPPVETTELAESGTTAATPEPPAGEEIRFAGPSGELIGLLATAADPMGAVLVIHENRGLTAHIRSIPPRLAADGYTALAIDLLSEEGGTASLPSEGDATAALGAAPAERLVADLRAGLDELERRAPGAKLAAIGFCFGGGMTWQLLAAGEPRLSAAVPFYGPAPADADFTGSPNAAVLGVFAELDARVNGSQDAARAGLEAAGLIYEIRVFPGVDHAFFNDTGARYNAEQAAAAYQAMLDWFLQYLAG